MFTPSRADVRRFFVETRRKRAAASPLTPLEMIAADWIECHPEYAADLDAPEADAAETAPPGDSENPFLHLSMHLAISEQLHIDRPHGIRAAYERLVARLGSPHAAQHEVMECLGEMLWNAQRGSGVPEGDAYLDCVQRRARR